MEKRNFDVVNNDTNILGWLASMYYVNSLLRTSEKRGGMKSIKFVKFVKWGLILHSHKQRNNFDFT